VLLFQDYLAKIDHASQSKEFVSPVQTVQNFAGELYFYSH